MASDPSDYFDSLLLSFVFFGFYTPICIIKLFLAWRWRFFNTVPQLPDEDVLLQEMILYDSTNDCTLLLYDGLLDSDLGGYPS